MKQSTKLIVKVPRTKHRADFLFHNGEFRPKTIPSAKVYNRKRLPKFDRNSAICYNNGIA